MGWGTPAEMDAERALVECCLFLRLSRSCAFRVGSARRRRMYSRLLFLRRVISESAFSRRQLPSFTNVCVRSSSTVASPTWRLCVYRLARQCSMACLPRCTLSALAHVAGCCHGSLRFSSSTATAVLLQYVDYMLRSHPCLPRWGDYNPWRADPWAARTRRLSL
jgi:hypothetical protein